MNPLSAVYGSLALFRRAWYDGHPERKRHLPRPVISVGNLSAGGSGKTPVVASIARLLQRRGERPAILSRGYARRVRSADPVVVSNGRQVLSDAAHAGDEPVMLARQLPGVAVIVCPNRYRAGLEADRLGCSVMLLDDGFQHLQLARTVDLVLVSPDDADDTLLPVGRLREDLSTARRADALLVPGSDQEAVRLGRRLDAARVFTVSTTYALPQLVASRGTRYEPTERRRVIAVAGIARPERFFRALEEQGWDIARVLGFRDHHWFTAGDIAHIAAAFISDDADVVMTTEKDAIRFEACGVPLEFPLAFLPVQAQIAPHDVFEDWLAERMAAR